MEKVNDLVIHCPNCSAYFPNEAIPHCRCQKCKFIFCFGCYKNDCQSTNCFKWWKIFISFYGLKEYRNENIFIKILMYLFMAIQTLFTFPLQVLYKLGPKITTKYNSSFTYEEPYKFRKKGLIYCFIMIPYHIAFIVSWIYITFFVFFLPGIFYPPYSVYWMGIFWYIQRHLHGGTFYKGKEKYFPQDSAQLVVSSEG